MKRFLSTVAALTIAFTAFSGTAKADNTFSLHLEPGIVQPMSAPQDNIYSTGVVLGAKGMFALTPNLSIGPSVSGLYLPRQVDNGQNAGVLWQFGGSARLQTDRRASNRGVFHNISPWIDTDLSLASTGNLLRPAFDVGVGAEVPLDQNHIAWIGPFVRYVHVFQTSDNESGLSLDPRDPNFLEAGVSVSFDTPTHPKMRVVDRNTLQVIHDTKSCPPQEVAAVVVPPVDKIDLSEKVYFDHDSSVLRWESNDKLDAIAKVLVSHPKFVIKVEGHASSDGQLDHNVKLAASRTASVVAYLTAHGVDASRLKSENLGVSKPTAPNTSKEGRERNRRVEFAVSFTSVEPTK
jgi:outer membrane protein OmpA-like peptidoglycan-associated protein